MEKQDKLVQTDDIAPTGHQSLSDNKDVGDIGQTPTFKRGDSLTKSLQIQRSYEKVRRSRSGSTASGRSGTFQRSRSRSVVKGIRDFFTNLDVFNERATLKEKVERLESDMKISLAQLEETKKENEQLQQENAKCKRNERDVMDSYVKMLQTYASKFDSLDSGDMQRYEIGTIHGMQIGSGNEINYNMFNMDFSELNALLLQYHENLAKALQDSQNASEMFKQAQTNFDLARGQIIELKDVQSELIEAIEDLKGTREELRTELEYTAGWADPRLMADCVHQLQTLTNLAKHCTFSDLPLKAKVGVMRIHRKYGRKLTVEKLRQTLGLDDGVGLLGSGGTLSLDDCASLLVEWVQKDYENNHVGSLLETLPKLKPGNDRWHFIQTHSPYFSSDSINSGSAGMDDIRDRLREMQGEIKDQLLEIHGETKDRLREMHGEMRAVLDEIKSQKNL